MIQKGFDRGFQLGALHSVLKVLEGNFGKELETEEPEDIEVNTINKEIVEIREKLEFTIPVIKIASNLYIDDQAE